MIIKQTIKQIKEALNLKTKIVFFGGAGVSTGSGIPDFRGSLTRMESAIPFEVLLSHSFFTAYPERFYENYWATMIHHQATPNLAHQTLAHYEKKGGRIQIITQNIDRLHQKAGSHNVIELHGNAEEYHCLECHKAYRLSELTEQGVPYCGCGGLIKPDVVLYEEPLPSKAIQQAVNAIRQADVLIIGGTSLSVYPAAGLIPEFHGSMLIIINHDRTPMDNRADYVFHEDVGEVLQALLG